MGINKEREERGRETQREIMELVHKMERGNEVICTCAILMFIVAVIGLMMWACYGAL